MRRPLGSKATPETVRSCWKSRRKATSLLSITDRVRPAEKAITPDNIAASFYHSLGIDHHKEYQTNIGLMALDVNVYADKKDYELELEVSDAEKGKDDFDAFLKENNIDFKYAKSKVARFVATLKRDKD